MKELGSFLLGIALMVLGGFLFLNNIVVQGLSSGWMTFGSRLYIGTNTITIVVLALIFCFVLMIVKPNFFTKLLTLIMFLMFVIAIILSLRFYFKSTNGFVVFSILAAFFGGFALVLKACLGIKKEDDEKKEGK